MHTEISVSELIAFCRHNLIDEWLWQNWNKSQNGKGASSLRNIIKDYQVLQRSILICLGLMLLSWLLVKEESLYIASCFFGFGALVFVNSFFKLHRALSRFGSDVYDLRLKLDAPFSNKPLLDQDWAKRVVVILEIRHAILVELDQMRNPHSTRARVVFDDHRRLFKLFILIKGESDDWNPPFVEARKRMETDPDFYGWAMIGYKEEIA